MVDASSDKNGRLAPLRCKDSENFWITQILDRELFEKVIFEMEIQKNSQFVAAS